MGKYTFSDGRNQTRTSPSNLAGPTIQDAANDFQYFVTNTQVLVAPWTLSWEPVGKDTGDKVAIHSYQSQEQREKMVEIAFALAYPRRATASDAWVFYDMEDTERDEQGFITNATITRVSTA